MLGGDFVLHDERRQAGARLARIFSGDVCHDNYDRFQPAGVLVTYFNVADS